MDFRKVIPLGLAVFLIACASALSASAADEGVQGLFESKCSACHNIDKTKSKTKTADDWLKTAQRMQKKRNSNISEEEAVKIADYLAKTYPKK